MQTHTGKKQQGDTEKIQREIKFCCRLGLEAICKIGPLFGDSIDADTIKWILDTEKNGVRILKWILAHNLEKMFPFFIDKSYR